MISIKYFDNFSAKNNNIIIFITKFSELGTFTLPFKLPINIKDESLLSDFESKKSLEIFHFDEKSNISFKILIKLINIQSNNSIEVGSSVADSFFNKYNILTFLFSKKIESKSLIPEIIFGFQIKSYSFDKYLNIKNHNPDTLLIKKINNQSINKINYNYNLVKSINFTKDLVSEPANVLNPNTYSKICSNIKIKGLKVKVLNLEQLNKIGLNSLTAVAQGSVNEPKVVIFEWNLTKNTKPTILVGKGVTFDSGGISIKPSSGMEEMIMDMGGSAVVVGSMMNAALNKIAKPIVGIIGLVENMPDGNAQRPGDIVKSFSGQTIEILNTDAEGRLVLADLISYVYTKYKPKQIIDFATLTGAIMVALGTHKAGLFSNNDKLSKKLIESGIAANENIWRLPLGSEYDEEINSKRADMKNIGSTRYGGSIQAAQFIKRFIKDNTPWAHLDIAGVTFLMKNNVLHKSGSTAFGVRLMDKFFKGK